MGKGMEEGGGWQQHLLHQCKRAAMGGEAGRIHAAPCNPRGMQQRWMMDQKLRIDVDLEGRRAWPLHVSGSRKAAPPILLFATMQDEKGHEYYSMAWYTPTRQQTGLSPATAVAVPMEEAMRAIGSHVGQAAGAAKGKQQEILCGEAEFREKLAGRETYMGREEMGLFFSMRPMPGSRFGLRYAHSDVLKPVVAFVSAFDVIAIAGEEGERQLSLRRFAGRAVERWYFDPAVCTRQEIVAENGVRGTLFVPRSAHHRAAPGVIDMFGTAGGILEFRASLYAARGLTALALPYFGYKDLPASMQDLTLDYFVRAVEWMCDRPEVDDTNGIGLSGVSFGGELVLQIARACPDKVKAVAAISPGFVNTCHGMTWQGKKLPSISLDLQKIAVREEPDQAYYKARADQEPHRVYDFSPTWERLIASPPPTQVVNAAIPVENMRCRLLLVAGADDQDWPAHVFCNFVYERLRRNGYAYPVEVAIYEKTGHLIEPPYSPFCSYSYHKLVQGSMMWGGEAAPHNKAQEQSWERIVSLMLSLQNPSSRL